MQKPLSSLKPESKASQKWQESQNYAKNPIWNVMLQLRGVGKVVVKILLIQFTSLTRTLLSPISVNLDHGREKKWKNIPRLRKKMFENFEKCLA